MTPDITTVTKIRIETNDQLLILEPSSPGKLKFCVSTIRRKIINKNFHGEAFKDVHENEEMKNSVKGPY